MNSWNNKAWQPNVFYLDDMFQFHGKMILILFLQMREHEKALRILLHQLNDFSSAEDYCNQMSSNLSVPSKKEKEKLLLILLTVLLDQDSYRWIYLILKDPIIYIHVQRSWSTSNEVNDWSPIWFNIGFWIFLYNLILLHCKRSRNFSI